MLTTIALTFVAAVAVVARVLIESGHLVGPLVYLSTPSPHHHYLPTLKQLGLLPKHCTYVTANASTITAEYTPEGSVITPDTKISLMSASKIVSAILILSVFPNPDQVQIQDILQLPPDLDEMRRNITVRELLSFTSGLERGSCEAKASGWRDCVVDILRNHYVPSQRGRFHYARSHLTVAGYLAVHHSNKTWTELLEEFVIQPAGVQPAPVWDAPELAHGELAFDSPVDHYDLRGTALVQHQARMLEHPCPAVALAGSAMQMVAVLRGILTGAIHGSHASPHEFRRQLFQPQSAVAIGLWQSYAAGNWRGRKVAHSQGMLGTFPYLVLQNTTPTWVGIFVQDTRRNERWKRFATAVGYFEEPYLEDSVLG